MTKITTEQLVAWQPVIDAINMPAYILNAKSQFVCGNANFFSFIGYEQNSIADLKIYDLIAPADKEKYAELDNEILQCGESLSFEGVIVDANQTTHPVSFEKGALRDNDKHIVAVLTTLHDHTDFENIRAALAKSESERQAILDGYPGMLALFNSDGELIWANDSMEDFSASVSDKTYKGIFDSSGVGNPASDVLNMALSGTQNTMLQQMSADGNEIYLEITGTPVRNESDEIRSAIIICHEVTEKFKLEKQLRHAQKMEAIGTLAGGIAHDFNNVLTPIMGYSEIVRLKMKMSGEADAELDEHLSEILRAARRAKGLVEQILTFSRSSEQKECMQYIHPIVKEVMKLMRVTLPSSVKIVEEIDETCGMVVVDPVLIHQVLINLCTNASHAMAGEQGTIKVKLAKVEEEFDGKMWLELSVMDTGCGIEPGMIDRIFEPYFTTKEKEQGTGMGLAMVHGIMERQGGRVEVESKIGEGTTFKTFLPMAMDGTSTSREQIVSTGDFIGGTGHILLVDDDKQVVRVTSDLLINLGYEVTGKPSPLEAFEFVKENGSTISLVITDLTMPEMNGVELTEKIKVMFPDLPVILFSGYSEQFSKKAAEQAGVNAYCIKPLSLRDIANVVRQVIDHKPVDLV